MKYLFVQLRATIILNKIKEMDQLNIYWAQAC